MPKGRHGNYGLIVLSGPVIVAALALSAACAATGLDRSWTAPALHQETFRRIVAIALTSDESRRAAMEDTLAGELVRSADGVTAEASYKSAGAETIRTEEGLREVLANSGADAVILMRPTKIRREDVWVPGRPTVAPVFYRTIWDYYAHWRPIALAPGYLATDHSVNVETTMFVVPDGDLVYTAISQTLNPSSPADLVKHVAQRLAKDLRDTGLIGTR